MSELSKLVFFGEVLPGHDVAAVKLKLAELLKLPETQADSLFSGRKVVLRKSLPAEQAASYVNRLEKIGVKVHLEPVEATPPSALVASEATLPVSAPLTAESPSPASSTQTEAARAALPEAEALASVPAALQLAPAEEVVCPKCGEHQPKRTLCRGCSIDMKRFAEAQQETEQQVREERMLAREVALASRGRGGRLASSGSERVGLLSLSFEGRMGRLNYWVCSFLVMTLVALSGWIAVKTGFWVLFAIGCLATIAFSVRAITLRCHDINLSGWLTLLAFIPYVGGLFGLILGFAPGTKGDNNYGPRSQRVGFMFALLILVVCGVSMSMFAKSAMALAKPYLSGYGLEGRHADRAKPTLTVAQADVEIFTTSSCGVCHMAKAYMDRRGISYAEKNVETNESYLREFYARGGRGVPYIFVGDESMSGFDANQLEQMLKRRS